MLLPLDSVERLFHVANRFVQKPVYVRVPLYQSGVMRTGRMLRLSSDRRFQLNYETISLQNLPMFSCTSQIRLERPVKTNQLRDNSRFAKMLGDSVLSKIVLTIKFYIPYVAVLILKHLSICMQKPLTTEQSLLSVFKVV